MSAMDDTRPEGPRSSAICIPTRPSSSRHSSSSSLSAYRERFSHTSSRGTSSSSVPRADSIHRNSNKDEGLLEYTYASDDASISAWLKCPICLAPFVEPVIVPNCEHVFCQRCIAKHMQRQRQLRDRQEFGENDTGSSMDRREELNMASSSRSVSRGSARSESRRQGNSETLSSCPSCRRNLNASNIRPAAMLIRNMVDSLLVKCVHHERGCTYVGERSLIMSHAQRDCGYAYVGEYSVEEASEPSKARRTVTGARKWQDARSGRCDCGKRVLVKDIDAHRSSGECNDTFVRCAHPGDDLLRCYVLVRESELDDHLETCAARKVQCPDCNESMLQGRMAGHDTSCMDKPVSCRLARFGCSWRGRRRDLHATSDSGQSGKGHLQECSLLPLEDFLLTQEARMEALEEANKEMSARLAAMEDREMSARIVLQACAKTIGIFEHCGEEHADGSPPQVTHEQDTTALSHSSSDSTLPPQRGRSQTSILAHARDLHMRDAASAEAPTASTSAPVPGTGYTWQWPIEGPHHSEQHSSVRHPAHSAAPGQTSLVDLTKDLTRRLELLSAQTKRMERHLDDAHVVSHNAAFEAGRANDDLNNVRHGVHALRLQMHSLLMMQQQQQYRGGVVSSSAVPATGVSSASIVGGVPAPRAEEPYSAAANSGAALGPLPLPAMLPYSPSSLPPMLGLRRYWTGFEHTKL